MNITHKAQIGVFYKGVYTYSPVFLFCYIYIYIYICVCVCVSVWGCTISAQFPTPWPLHAPIWNDGSN